MIYKLIVEYNGKNFIGWQKNSQGDSIQSSLEDAVYKFSKEITKFVAAGRTDAGVHAIAMPCHFNLNRQYPENTIKNALGRTSAFETNSRDTLCILGHPLFIKIQKKHKKIFQTINVSK